MKDITPIEILEKLDTFYNNAWDKLIIYNTIFLAIIGVVIPFIIQWWQNRSLKIKEEALKNELKDFFEIKYQEFTDKLVKAVDEKFNIEVQEIKKYQDKIQAGLQGSYFHLQANNEMIEKEKMKSLIWAADNYIKGSDFLNLIIVLEMIEYTLPALTNEDFNEIYVEDADIDELIKILDETENNSSYVHLIRKIKIALSKVRKSENK